MSALRRDRGCNNLIGTGGGTQWRLVAFLLLSAALAEPAMAQRADFASLEGRPRVQFELPRELDEISGLAWHPDGFLLAHNDEFEFVYRLNPLTGRIEGRSALGSRNATGDFEGIALGNGDQVALVTSQGRLVRHQLTSGETSNRSLALEDVCEVEGLATARSGTDLILACKTLYQGSDRDALVLLKTPWTEDHAASVELLLRIESDALRRANVPRPFSASGIAVVDRGYLVLSARRERVLLVSESGTILGVARLDKQRHPQAEGITVDSSGSIWIADEGDGGRGRLTRYGGERD